MIEIEATDQTTVLVCVTCRTPNDVPDAPLGLLLAEATFGAARDDAGISVQRVRCLGNCSRGPSAAIRNQHTWTYVFGGLDDPLRDGPALVAGARLLASASDGLMPWRGRPESLKRGLIARVPPIGWHDDTEVKPA